ncbi:hypothetical protein [Glycomyces artemisiae]|uniref:Uncharacterized protein n=1 Tax=Glycomyces artemisiae TaxID=1076443 RepID=A0A2T0UL18_9ACTN|nr:hypothetical protein [Glycomyces artemisiae]PRY58586.1 hypothetical protein B0I28_105299 [Glycomyces artemisiae]
MTAPALATRRYGLGAGLAGAALNYFKYWMLAAAVLCFAVPLLIAQYAGIELSAWYYAVNAGKWFTAFVGGGFVFTLLPQMIAAGLTRRELAAAMGVFGVLWSLALGAVGLAGLFAERAYYGAFGWSQGIDATSGIAPIGSAADTAAFAAYLPLLFLAYFAAGTVIGVASYRWEHAGWLLLVPVLPVVFGLDVALYSTEPVGPGWIGFLGRFIDEWGRGPLAAAIVLATAVLAVAARRLLIDVPLRSKQA